MLYSDYNRALYYKALEQITEYASKAKELEAFIELLQEQDKEDGLKQVELNKRQFVRDTAVKYGLLEQESKDVPTT